MNSEVTCEASRVVTRDDCTLILTAIGSIAANLFVVLPRLPSPSTIGSVRSLGFKEAASQQCIMRTRMWWVLVVGNELEQRE